MKLLMTTDTLGGVFVYATELIAALQRFEVEVVLATQGAPLTDDQRVLLASLNNVSLYESDYRLEWMNNPWEDVRDAGQWLQWIARREQPDLIHLNDYSHGGLRWTQPVLMVVHSCVYSWFLAVRGEQPDASWESYRRRVTRGLRRADLVVAPTAAMLASAETTYGPFRASQVIVNGRDRLDAPQTKSALILSAGRVWDEAKNIGMVARAAARLRWPVYVAGQCQHPDGGGERRFDGVRFLGRLASDALADWYGRAAIYALPARYEPFGLTALEAGLAGCALVLGDIPSLREVWGEAALFVDPDDDDALVATLNRLADDCSLRTTMADRAQRRARQMTASRMARAYFEAYQQLLQHSLRPAAALPVFEEA